MIFWLKETLLPKGGYFSRRFLIQAPDPKKAKFRVRVKSPKIFFRDSGLFHALLGIHQYNDLHYHPKLGASWEGFAMEEIIRFHGARSEDCFFWSTYDQSEIDLLIYQKGKLHGN